MHIVVCVRQDLAGELSPFDACAYEAALRVDGAAVTLLSMGPPKTAELLTSLTRLGAARAVLLSDRAFSGADTLATAYTLSLAIKKLSPDLIFCGRQTLIGDTGQVGPMLAAQCGAALVTSAMEIAVTADGVCCKTRDEGEKTAPFPAVVTVERINTLRLPSLRSKCGTVETWDAAALGADISRCGLVGSPTRVIESRENTAGRRHCRFITPAELPAVIENARRKSAAAVTFNKAACPLAKVLIVGETPRAFAEAVGKTVVCLSEKTPKALAAAIRAQDPDAVLFGTDAWSRRMAALIAGENGLGLCADCTALETDGKTLFMIRPALSGSVIAKIKSNTRPAMATVRTTVQSAAVTVGAGFGVKNEIDRVRAFAEKWDAALAASRRLVDDGVLPYALQVGLTGKTVAPPVYIAVGISGAVHHIVGMQRAGTVIAINPDRKAPIFDYADFGIVADFDTIDV